MRYRKLASDMDMTFGNSQDNFYRDVPEAVGQAVQTRLSQWRGEWFLNSQDGVPFFEGILGKKTKQLADATIQETTLNTQGVIEISSYSSDLNPDTRKLSAALTVTTIYGVTKIDSTIQGNF